MSPDMGERLQWFLIILTLLCFFILAVGFYRDGSPKRKLRKSRRRSNAPLTPSRGGYPSREPYKQLPKVDSGPAHGAVDKLIITEALPSAMEPGASIIFGDFSRYADPDPDLGNFERYVDATTDPAPDEGDG